MKHDQFELKIRITQLSEGIHSYSFTSNPEQLALGEGFRDTVEIAVELDKTQRQIFLKTSVLGTFGFHCDRCGNPAESKVEAKYALCYEFAEKVTDNATEDDLRFIHLGTPFLNITEDVRQSLLLAVPMKQLCNEECKGLCPTCGINLNETECTCTDVHIDSRWEQLRNLITETNN